MIESTANKQVKNLIQLMKKSRTRREEGLFVVEGVRMFREVSTERLVRTYVSEGFLEKEENRAVLKDIPYEVMTDKVFTTVSDTQTPQGVLCVVRQKEYTLDEMLKKEHPHLMILENLQDPGNLGTIFRTAEGAGVDGIIMSADTVDIYNPKTVRSTMGSLYRMPFSYEKDLDEVLRKVKERQVAVYAAHLKGRQNYYQEDYTKGCAFLIGNEGNGLTDHLAEQADTYIRIPMEGQVESLNAAVAEALVDFKKRVDAEIAAGKDKHKAIVDILREDIKTCKPIRFDGNGYSDEWVEEATKRGLDVEKSCPIIFERYLDDSSVKMFESLGIMSKKELEARNEVKWETYTKKIQIEARVMGDLSMNHIIPIATHYQSMLVKNVLNMRNIFSAEKAEKLSERNIKLIEEIADRTQTIERGVEELVNARKVANKIESEHDKAIAYHDTVAPKMEDIRYQIDKLELIVEDDLWTLPKYRELLFIR